MTAPTKPLAGLRVLDLTRLLPGPMCTLHLADMGADVIKIEDPKAGDYARWYEPRRHTHSAIFLMLNRNKRSVVLDLRRAEGRDAFLKLAEGADVVVEGFRPGVMDRLGIGYEAVSARNKRIVFCAAVDRNGNNAQAFNQLGIVYRKLGRFKEADVAYQRAVEIDASYAIAWLNLGVLCDLYLQQPQRALEAYERYLALAGAPDEKVNGWVTELRKRLGSEPRSARAQ